MIAYARAVVEEEWPAMARGGAPIADAASRVVALYRVYDRVEGGALGASARYAASLDELDELDDARGLRLLASRRGLPGLMWTVLVAGGVLTVGFAYFFGVENRIAQGLMLAALAALIALLLLLVRSLDAPFRGAARLPPDGFARMLDLAEREAGAVPFAPAADASGRA